MVGRWTISSDTLILKTWTPERRPHFPLVGARMTQMDSQARRPLQFRLGTFLLVIAAFALGLAARNIADGLYPLAMSLSLPKSNTPLRPGDVLLRPGDVLRSVLGPPATPSHLLRRSSR